MEFCGCCYISPKSGVVLVIDFVTLGSAGLEAGKSPWKGPCMKLVDDAAVRHEVCGRLKVLDPKPVMRPAIHLRWRIACSSSGD